jgi:tRNA(fMet)-specific endonuclease VapC
VVATQRGLLDTNTLILLERLGDESNLPRQALISSITLAELSVGPLVAEDAAERAARQARLQQAEADFAPLPFDAAAARVFGRVAASLRQAGRKTQARAYDAMIAAIAIANELPLYTCNPEDFEHIDELDLRPVPHPAGATRSDDVASK